MSQLHDENNAMQVNDTPARLQEEDQLPDIEQAVVMYYAYDPQTYEILCRPGQRLSEKKAQRLQELNIYARVVSFAEVHSP
jgi:hypothetical protein